MFYIQEAAKRIGRTSQTLANWDRTGVFVAQRDSRGNRVYSDDDVALLKQIAKRSLTAMRSSKPLGAVCKDINPQQQSFFKVSA